MLQRTVLLCLFAFLSTAFSCSENNKSAEPPPARATLQISASLVDAPEVAMRSDTYAIVGGQRVLLGASGRATVSLDPGTYDVLVVEPGAASGREQVTLVGGEERTLAIAVGQGFGTIEFALAVAAPTNTIVAAAAPQLRIEARSPAGAALPIDQLQAVSVRAVGRSSSTNASNPRALSVAQDVTSAFTISGNGVVLTDAARFSSVVSTMPEGSYVLHVAAYDSSSGILYTGEVLVQFGDSSLSGRLLPGNTNASVQGSVVRLQILGTGIDLTSTVGSDGRYSFSGIPSGNVYATVELTIGDRTVSAQELVFVDETTSQDLMLSDLGGFQLAATMTSRAAIASPMADQRSLPDRRMQITGPVGPLLVFSSNAISVTGAARDVPVRAERTYQVAESATSVTVRYAVNTAEYPTYVQAQSIYNDTWSLTVHDASGRILESRARGVNSQLNALEPFWRADGSTGEIELPVDVTNARVVNGQRPITIRIQTKNVGDGALATTVRAEVASAPFRLELGNLSTVPRGCNPRCRNQNVPVISIPNQGDSNALDRTVQVTLVPTTSQPISLSQVTRVKITAQSGAASHSIYDSGTVPNPDTNTRFLAPVAFRPITRSSPFGAPPPVNPQVSYIVEVTVDGQTVSATTPAYTALWRAAAASRGSLFGGRDLPGGDDWASFAMYHWLLSNFGSLPRQNDVSGQHGQDIGHASHQFGNDVDLFLFGTEFASSTSRANQAALESVVSRSVNQTPDGAAALASLQNWVIAMRAGIQRLCNDASVTLIIGPLGQEVNSGGIPAGWAKNLILTGSTPISGNTTLSVGGSLTCSKYASQSDHNDHVHVRVR